MKQYTRWVYGQHPPDEMIQSYIDRGEMYMLMDGDEIAGMAAIVLSQGKETRHRHHKTGGKAGQKEWKESAAPGCAEEQPSCTAYV